MSNNVALIFLPYIITDMIERPFFILNFKMYFAHDAFRSFLNEHAQALHDLANDSKSAIVILPSFENIASACAIFKNKAIKIGAQSCSAHIAGAYTAQVAAISLAELGCSYCLVGHSEDRSIHFYSNQDLACKIERCFQAGLTPIFCIGESLEHYQKGQTLSFLQQQLTTLSYVAWHLYGKKKFFVAYEPIWAIGTGLNPSKEHLLSITDYLKKFLYDNAYEAGILYGGSVTEKSAISLQAVPILNGFLIGKSSTDFQVLKNIVLSNI